MPRITKKVLLERLDELGNAGALKAKRYAAAGFMAGTAFGALIVWAF
jgi:hypothetical protein